MENTVEQIMKYEPTLPEDFDGTFRFTNDSDDDFIGTWGKKQYRFPAHTTSPMPAAELNATPLEVQSIRKKFARDWAEQQFFKGVEYKKLLKQERNDDGSARLSGIHGAGTYSTDSMVSLIQRCLVPLKVSKAVVTEVPAIALEDKLSKDDEGTPNTVAVKPNSDLLSERKSLKKKALGD